VELSQLETDLLGDMAQDDHCLFEVFQFVRLHHGLRCYPCPRSVPPLCSNETLQRTDGLLKLAALAIIDPPAAELGRYDAKD
jgi:hypothetical protein